jgi:hypothetical protein
MFVTATQETGNDSLVRADFTGRFLILTNINLGIGIPSVVQFRCPKFLIVSIIDFLIKFPELEYCEIAIDSLTAYGEVPLVLTRHYDEHCLTAAGQCFSFYNKEAVISILTSVLEQYNELD